MKSKVFVALGFLSVAMGILGIFLPVLPTTPFLILAAFLFSKGNPKWHTWLREHKTLGPPLREWEDHRRIRISTKVYATVLILLSALIMFFYSALILPAKYVLIGLLSGVTLFIWTRKS